MADWSRAKIAVNHPGPASISYRGVIQPDCGVEEGSQVAPMSQRSWMGVIGRRDTAMHRNLSAELPLLYAKVAAFHISKGTLNPVSEAVSSASSALG